MTVSNTLMTERPEMGEYSKHYFSLGLMKNTSVEFTRSECSFQTVETKYIFYFNIFDFKIDKELVVWSSKKKVFLKEI